MASKNNEEAYMAYIKAEEDWNHAFKQMANCHRFVELAGKLADIHLTRVEAQKAMMENWLDFLGIATKEEIADAAKPFISNENKLDSLDDQAYLLTANWNSRKHSLITLKEILDELTILLEEEYFENKNNKIKSLVNELNEVKESFTGK